MRTTEAGSPATANETEEEVRVVVPAMKEEEEEEEEGQAVNLRDLEGK